MEPWVHSGQKGLLQSPFYASPFFLGIAFISCLSDLNWTSLPTTSNAAASPNIFFFSSWWLCRKSQNLSLPPSSMFYPQSSRPLKADLWDQHSFYAMFQEDHDFCSLGQRPSLQQMTRNGALHPVTVGDDPELPPHTFPSGSWKPGAISWTPNQNIWKLCMERMAFALSVCYHQLP